jgi:hypothetical protein
MPKFVIEREIPGAGSLRRDIPHDVAEIPPGNETKTAACNGVQRSALVSPHIRASLSA